VARNKCGNGHTKPVIINCGRRSFPALRVSSGCGYSLKIAVTAAESRKGILVMLMSQLGFGWRSKGKDSVSGKFFN